MKCVFNQLLIQSGTEMFFLEYFVPFIQWNWVMFCVKFPHYIKKGVMDEIYLTGMIFVNNILWEKIFGDLLCFCETLVTMQLITSCFTHLIAKSTCWESLKNWHKLPHIRRLFITINYKILLVFPKDCPINSSNLQDTSPSILINVRQQILSKSYSDKSESYFELMALIYMRMCRKVYRTIKYVQMSYDTSRWIVKDLVYWNKRLEINNQNSTVLKLGIQKILHEG